MSQDAALNPESITALVITCLEEVLEQQDEMPETAIDATTPLLGRQAVLNSMGLVTMIVDLEQQLDVEYGVSITIADERAMSQRSSPFRTVASLAEYVGQLIEET